jgi:hypothetical protein
MALNIFSSRLVELAGSLVTIRMLGHIWNLVMPVTRRSLQCLSRVHYCRPDY